MNSPIAMQFEIARKNDPEHIVASVICSKEGGVDFVVSKVEDLSRCPAVELVGQHLYTLGPDWMFDHKEAIDAADALVQKYMGSDYTVKRLWPIEK